MKRATLLTITVALVVALTAGVALAATFVGGPGNNNISGTNGDDFIRGLGGNDTLQGRLGNDRIYGGDGADRAYGSPGNDVLNGSAGNDRLYPQEGRDTVSGANGDDRILARGDGVDKIYCGPGFDVAYVSINDLVGGTSVNDILSSVTTVEQDALSCEVLVLEGLRIPLGAIVALPAGLEADVSLLLEEYLRDGELSAGEIRNLERVFGLINDGDIGLLEALLDLLLG